MNQSYYYKIQAYDSVSGASSRLYDAEIGFGTAIIKEEEPLYYTEESAVAYLQEQLVSL